MSNPKPLTPQQLARLRAFISAEPLMNHQEFTSKWDVNRELVAEICHVDIRTCNCWFSQGFSHQDPQLYHKWYLTIADLILDQYEYIPEFLQILLCPDDF
ncbi:helix-turn-helix domain-containing protein [Nostoc sp. FACHB-133]|uniref:helix-turn-helix domain-containing protein n=1 Tax=Nostoc sp. FACHB-133 TaxID=2692835 RepID=UPI0016850AEF|nr:helix-turn-helix domain-containing protein [Nostoc sp. FACHB-133]MBD2527371.1 helix-turn-helix domain-containing protein [Nostoc sp. FACHB-133]